MKFIHTADLHLMSGDSPRAKGAFEAFRKVCALVKERGADLLIIAGDAFHTPTDAKDGALLSLFKKELEALAPAKVVLIPGNHELNGVDRAFRSLSEFPDNCHAFEAEGVLEVGGVAVHAFPFKKDSRTSELFASLPALKPGECRIAVLHGTAADRPNLAMYAIAEGEEPGGDALIFDVDLAKAGFRYAALGHIHKPDAWDLGKGARAAYPGSPWCVTVGEQDIRSAQVVEIEPASGKVTDVAVPLGTPRAERRDFLVAPGLEKEAAAEITAWFKDCPKDTWRTAYPCGLGEMDALGKAAIESETAACGAMPPKVEFRDRNFHSISDEPPTKVQAEFIARMSRRIKAAVDAAEREVLCRALLLGWSALREPGKDTEDAFLDAITGGVL